MPEFNPTLVPTRSPIGPILIAAGILIAGAAAFFIFTPRERVELSVTSTKMYTAHTETRAMKGNGTHIIGAPARIEDDLYVLLNIKVTDKSSVPLFVKDETAVLTAPDHSITEVSSLQKPELANLYLSFPQVQAIASPPLARDTRIAPHQSAEGMVLLHFPGMTEKNWNERGAATVTLEFFHQNTQTLTIPK